MPSRLSLLLAPVVLWMLAASAPAVPMTPLPAPPPTLEAVQCRAFAFFWNESDLRTGLTKDRARNRPGPPDTYSVASIAATGYALAALPVGVSHGWVSRTAAYARALTTLRFVQDKMENSHGFYFHFVDKATGVRVWKSELSSVDTALLLLGARVAGDFWPGTEVQRLADGLTDRADWPWMRDGGEAQTDPMSLSMGWRPETGWIKARWQGYSEASFLYWLALGSRTHPLTARSWDSWDARPSTLEGYAVFGGAEPLFMAQMAPGFYDLRGLRDRQGRDWWAAWRNAHRADRAYCARNPDRRKTYAEGFWGVSANDQPPPVGYGASASAPGRNDGTVSPTAMLSGILFTPESSRAALAALWRKHGPQLWGRYGFSNAFNVDRGWYDTDVIGIDLGMVLLATENARTGLVWRLLKSDPVIKRGRTAAGFHRSSERKAGGSNPCAAHETSYGERGRVPAPSYSPGMGGARALGVVVAQAACALLIGDDSDRAQAQRIFLTHRFLEDWSYQTVTRREARAEAERLWGRRDPAPDDMEHQAALCAFIADRLAARLSDLQARGIG